MQKNYLIALVLLVFFLFIFLMLFTKSDKNKVFILFVIFILPFLSINIFPSFGNITTFECLIFIFYLFFYKSKNVHVVNGIFYLVLFVLLSIVSLIGIFNASTFTNDTIIALVQYVCIFAFAKILISECFENSLFYNSVINALKVTVLFSLLFLLCQFIFGVNFSLDNSLNNNVLSLDVIRYPSFFQDPQKYAQYLSATSFLFLIKDKQIARLPIINILFVCLSILALLFTGGRAGFGGWCIGFLIFLIFSNSKLKIVSIITLLILAFVVNYFSQSFSMFQRSSVGDAYDFRMSIWQDAINIFNNHPFFGIGNGNYSNYVAVHNPDQFWMSDNKITYFNHPESGYLKFLTEFGIIGFTLVLTFILFPVFFAFSYFRKSKDINIILIIAALSSWLVGFYTVYSLDDSRIRVLIVILIGLLITYYQNDFHNDISSSKELIYNS
jgi:O-antigen ligase